MILDSSVLAHIALGEPGWEDSLRWLSQQPHLRLSAASLVESHAVLKYPVAATAALLPKRLAHPF